MRKLDHYSFDVYPCFNNSVSDKDITPLNIDEIFPKDISDSLKMLEDFSASLSDIRSDIYNIRNNICVLCEDYKDASNVLDFSSIDESNSIKLRDNLIANLSDIKDNIDTFNSNYSAGYDEVVSKLQLLENNKKVYDGYCYLISDSDTIDKIRQYESLRDSYSYIVIDGVWKY
ncbi:MAG: hypothetical protein IJ842_05205 [Bacilli bacterium]|nr:hypothetical protein [Bacilli bacterium]